MADDPKKRAVEHLQRAAEAYNRRELDAAAAEARAAIASWPDNPNFHHFLGLVLYRQGAHEAAAERYETALAANPDDPRRWLEYGDVLAAVRRPEDAIGAYRRSLAIAPARAETMARLGAALLDSGADDEARGYLEQAVADDPNQLPALEALARLEMGRGHVDKAITLFRRSLDRDPNRHPAAVNLGTCLMMQGAFGDASVTLAATVEADPENAAAHWNYALALLATGDYARGWREYEWRWQTEPFQRERRQYAQPQWRGEDPGSSTLLLYAEQGIGDIVMFLRYVPMVAARAPEARLVLELPDRLVDIGAVSFGDIAAVVPRRDIDGRSLPPFDRHAALGSLPYLLGTTLETVPARVPYLRVPEAESRVRVPREGPVVGLSWFSKNAQTGDRRSIPLSALAPLAAARPDARFVNLQYGDTGAERAEARRAGIDVSDDQSIDLKADLSGLAQRIADCDLVISIDNTTVHMAGALARPVWTLLPHGADWRWMDRALSTTPWYPTMRLIRQPAAADWPAAVGRAAAMLADFRSPDSGTRGVIRNPEKG